MPSRYRELGESMTENLSQPKAEFFPLLDDFLDYVNVPCDKFSGARKVLVSLDFLRALIGLAAGELAFDEKFYKGRYPDLRRAVETGEIPDLKSHFVNHGFFERRQGSVRQVAPVDEEWYLTKYPDVAKGVVEGSVPSATAHYLVKGRQEGRRPANNLSDAANALIESMHSPKASE